MDISEIKNKHFRIAMNEIKKFIDLDQSPPEDLFFKFIEELKASNLIISGILEGESITYEIRQIDDGSEWIFLFTDETEYLKFYSNNNDYEPLPNEFGFYADSINNSGINGLVINVESEQLILEKDLINDINTSFGINFEDNFQGYGPEQLKNTISNISNDSLVNFIQNESNFGDYDGLFLEFSKSLLLNVIISNENLDKYAKNGVISAEDVGGFDLCTSSEEDETYAIIFSSIDAITKTMKKDTPFYFYSQITIFSKLVDYVLYSDLEGIILNPGLENVFIPRDILLSKKSNLAIIDNPSFKNAIDYAFLL